MIVDCPYCNTSNSESDYATGADGTVVCRACARRFKAPEQAQDMGANTTQVARKVLEERQRSDVTNPQTARSTASARFPRATEVTRVDGAIPDGDGPTRVGGAPPQPPMDDGPTRVGGMPLAPHDEPVTVVRASPVAHLTEDTPAPRSEGTGKTKMMNQQDLYRALIESETITHEETVAGVKLPPPSQASQPVVRPPSPPQRGLRPWALLVRERGLEAWGLFQEQPRPVRIASAVSVALLLILVAVSLRLATRSNVSIAYAAEIQALLSAPAEGAHGAMGNLRRGEQVTVFDTVGNFVMVRDLQGRVGYVREMDLVRERPGSPPDSPFVDCKPAAAESDMRGCEERAEEQWESCLGLCEKANALSKCNDDCRGQYRVCLAACHGEAVHPEPGLPSSAMPTDAPPAPAGPAPVPTPAPAPTTATPAPAAAAHTETAAPSHSSSKTSSKSSSKKIEKSDKKHKH